MHNFKDRKHILVFIFLGYYHFSLYILMHNFKDRKHILVFIFLGYYHFSLYILFLRFLIPILKNAFHFGPYCYIRNRKN